jgi:hypothetical protein
MKKRKRGAQSYACGLGGVYCRSCGLMFDAPASVYRANYEKC